jgi:ABC-type polysaccharide/polyol phosphate export permease
MQLISRDFKSRYAGSALGVLWAFLQPLCMMAILWFVFEHGLKASKQQGDVPFVAWFFSAMIAWNLFAEILQVNTNVISEYSFLLKKINFPVTILPLVKIGSSLLMHFVFVGLLCCILTISGVYPSWHWLQFIYYLAGLLVLLLGLGWATSALNVFLKDVGQLVGISVQFGFWMTPVIWNIQALPENYRWLIKLNPVFYIVDGYRQTFIYHQWFWEQNLALTAYFWAVAFGVLFAGGYLFSRLKIHFTDVL